MSVVYIYKFHGVQAIREGADAVIVVGGDGTLHELSPLGTGSDFARTFGWKNDPHEAIDRIVKGITCPFLTPCHFKG
ncbi:hypothetical protein Pint_29622 [Pistacia integerrima]|uniref:Uncharacterized protein n=1 Tax=Pistacia integerrima TaxID=434235 RepID=A0ACC0X0G1_9ROSI|nr:hypothetical protein Pint_29622 [Pistacia integerrima]